MKSFLDCIPCFFEQALRAGRIATDDEKVQKRLLEELGKNLSNISLESTPPETGRLIYRMVREITGNPDPFRELKRKSTEQALTLYPSLKTIIEESNDKLLTAIRLAIAGNVIDLGASATFDLDLAIKDSLENKFAICDYSAFKKYLAKSEHILYLGDNAGETVFDKLLIEQMNKPVTYVVRETPVINDATAEDAIQAGIDKVATIVSSGSDAPGIIPRICSPELRERLDKSDFIIAKGQGNYEGLSNENYRIFFLLKAKCQIIADDIGIPKGSIMLKGINI
ncbi:MAG: ARMT1-like domain-containing protein [candidate division Zixibacteria bacterium]|nr:ARMT1-like domain-containing protein [candidate division Zixibacteria bacterium]